MRKQIVFEQNSASTCLVNIRNIFGFSINYVEDKIKKHEGKWDIESRKFSVPLSQLPELTKQLQLIDRSFYIEQIPSAVSEMCHRYCSASGSHKVKKQILIDKNIAKRYEYIQENVLKSILVNCKEKALYQSKNYDKIIIVTPQWKVSTWIELLEQSKVKKIKFQLKQKDECMKQQCIWILSYEQLWSKFEQLQKYCLQTFIVDEAEILAIKIASQHESALSFKRLLLNRHFVFLIMSKMHLNRLEILLPLFSIVIPQTNLSWMSRRYRKQNLIQLNYVIKTCGLVRDINCAKLNKSQSCRHFFSKFYLNLSEQAADKIKTINKKNSQLEHKRILESPANVRNKAERSYLDSINEVFRQEKQESIHRLTSYYCLELNLRIALIIESSTAYRSVENYLCQNQIAYCHYEHPASVLQFNKNPSISAILLKWQHVQSIQFAQHSDEKLENYEPEQFLCITGVRHLIMVDVDWGMGPDVKKREEKYWQIFRYSASFNSEGGNGDLVRHYFILKNTYEEKWISMLEENIIKVQMNLKVKQDIRQQQEQQQLADQAIEGNSDPAFGFCELSLAKVQQEYSHLKIIKGVTDIDDEFDKLEYEALQQKTRRQSRKKMKEQKAREKECMSECEHQQKPQFQKQLNTKIAEDFKQLLVHEVSSDQQYEMFLNKHQPESMKSGSSAYQQPKQVSIYEPVEPNKIILEAKTTEQSKQDTANPTEHLSSGLRKDQQHEPRQESSHQQKQPIFNLDLIDNLKQDETQQIQIIEVRKPTKKPRVPKPKSQVMSVILRPWPLS